MSYEVSTNDVVEFRGRLWLVCKHYRGTKRVTLVPVRSAEAGRMYIQDGKPHVFKEITVQREASRLTSFAYMSAS